MKSLIVLIILSVFLSLVSGCGTMRGVGKDVEDAGEGIQRAID